MLWILPRTALPLCWRAPSDPCRVLGLELPLTGHDLIAAGQEGKPSRIHRLSAGVLPWPGTLPFTPEQVLTTLHGPRRSRARLGVDARDLDTGLPGRSGGDFKQTGGFQCSVSRSLPARSLHRLTASSRDAVRCPPQGTSCSAHLPLDGQWPRCSRHLVFGSSSMK